MMRIGAVKRVASSGLIVVAVAASACDRAPAGPPQRFQASGNIAVAAVRPPGSLQVDGSKTPGAIPQWLLWRESFNTMAVAHERKMVAALAILVLTPRDEEILFPEAASQATRDRDCHEQWDRQYADLLARHSTTAAMTQVRRAAAIGCRTKTIEARDRVLARLTPPARASLLAWVEQMRPNITYYAGPRDAAYFQVPE